MLFLYFVLCVCWCEFVDWYVYWYVCVVVVVVWVVCEDV